MSNHEHHGMKPLEGMRPYCTRSAYGEEGEAQRDDRFGRLFDYLSPAYTDPRILREIGAAEDGDGNPGPMNAGNKNDPTDSVAVGMVFFGQFVDHDVTLDASTTFDSVIDNPGEIANVRTPTLDLDCIYGLGPEAQPYLFSQTGDFAGAKLLVGADNPGQDGLNDDDVLRSPNGRAIIGDPRNDENRIISQMQLAIIRFHNHVCDTLNAEDGLTGHDLYEAAREQTTWHYQWGVVNDFLTAMCGKPVVEKILGCGRQVYCSEVPFIPVEFSVAAYRFGHSMIPMKIQTQTGGAKHELFGTILGQGFDPVSDPKAVVDFHELFFTDETRQVERAQKLDLKLAGDLLALPFVNGPPEDKSLATRNLRRGNAFLLPGGEKVAAEIGCDDLQIKRVVDAVTALHDDLPREGIPLWLYILGEAQVVGRAEPDGSTNEGEALGPVGATIVAETIIGLLELDDHSYLGSNRDWIPREDWNTLGKLITVAQP